MTTQLRRVAMLTFVLFGALLVNVTYHQVYMADDYRNDPRNSRGLHEAFETRRGLMIAADGQTDIADVERMDEGLRYRRRYSDGPLYGHVTGYQSVNHGSSELERTFSDYLQGAGPERFARNFTDLVLGRERTGDDLRLTIHPDVQRAAREGLGDRAGSVVALDPETGAILALWSNPTYEPDRMASHNTDEAAAYRSELLDDPTQPLLNRAIRQTYPPGSTFKLVTTAAALESGISADDTYDDPERAELPQTTASIGNFGGGRCAGGDPITLARAVEVSCNTTFAQIGLELGAEPLIEQAEAFGFNAPLIEQLPDPADSRMPDDMDEPQTAQSAIGQFDVRATPLQMAMVSAAIANGGTLMEPRVVDSVIDPGGGEVATFAPTPLTPDGQAGSEAVSEDTAATMTEMMEAVVASGTGTAAQIDGVQVAGKTGTAQTAEGRPPHVWFTGFAPSDDPRVAVAVVIETGGEVGDEATGGRVAAPVARAVMEAALTTDDLDAPDEDG